MPRAQTKKYFADGKLVTAKELAEFSVAFVVSEELVNNNIDHLKHLSYCKNLRTQETGQKRCARASTVQIRRNLTGNTFANGNRMHIEQVQEREQNGYRMSTERISNGNGADTEQFRITKMEESVPKNASYKRACFSEHMLRLRYQSAYQGFGNDVTSKY